MITVVIGILESRVITVKINTQSQMAHDPPTIGGPGHFGISISV